ncbi:MAG: hypothetical protein QOF58_4698 [Pseudonocardiales bacterium]|jgi:lysophospholipase L1-like esterase|nr:hypothetical protein [Pseudonocardiales bacterium]
MRVWVLVWGAAVAGAAGLAVPEIAGASKPRWIAAWGAPVGSVAVSGIPLATGTSAANTTMRSVARVSIGGSAVRIRVSNAASVDAPLTIGRAAIGLQKTPGSPELVAGSLRPITFNGQPGITLPPKTDAVYSDPIELPVKAQQDLAVSLFLPGPENPPSPGASYSTQFAAASDAGDLTQDVPGTAFTGSGTSTFALTAVDVLTTEADGAIVGLGSSTFHGSNSTQDAYNRVLDLLSTRINAGIPSGTQKGIVSAGIGGDTLHAGLDRLDRDVLTQSGVAGVMVYDVNDLSSRTAEEVKADYRILIARAHAREVRVLCPTWPPAAQSAPSTVRSNERRKLNTWLLQGGECDDIVDWDSVLRGAVAEDEYDPAYLSDGIHPNPAGHAAMADATPLRWFRFTVPGPAEAAAPAAPTCTAGSVLSVRFNAPAGAHVKSARVYVNGRLARVYRRLRGRSATVRLRRLPAGEVTVRIAARTAKGKAFTRTKRYSLCG